MLDLSDLDLSNAINKAKIEMKHENDMVMVYITMAFKTNTTMNHVDECKSTDWTIRLVGKLLEELRKWA